MVKVKTTIFFYKECGYKLSKWVRQCPACKAWNSMVEELVSRSTGSRGGLGHLPSGSRESPILTAKLSLLLEIDIEEQNRISTGSGELDRVPGDEIVAGSLVLVGGDPNIRKSTPLLQICRNLVGTGRRALYISGKESLRQIKMRANRIGSVTGELKFLCEASLEHIERTIDAENPQITVIGSVQTMYGEEVSSTPGGVNQVRGSTGILMQIAKSCGIAIFMVGHVIKEDVVAGPRVLEHMVDTVLYFEGDRNASYRILQSVKDRFGSTNEIDVFRVQGQGLAEVKNPSEYMLDGQPKETSGAVVSCSFKGIRPILLEVQALVTGTNFGMPRRTMTGVDYNHVNLLMTVLEERCRYEMSRLDVYMNIAGGMKMNEPALDLVIVMALMSSYKDRPVDSKMFIFGEVGLSGEVRVISQADQRVDETARLDFTTYVLPKVCVDKMKQMEGIRLIEVSNVRGAIGII